MSLWVQLDSAAAHGAPPLGKGDGRISASHNFTAELLGAHQLMTESQEFSPFPHVMLWKVEKISAVLSKKQRKFIGIIKNY